jgi:NAD(P)-dependent dehydrogenase (short-subunit alcohol dehydrogenase family)
MSGKTETYYRDKVAIVTGGASGIGLALCQALSRCGARVVVADIDSTGAESVAGSIASSGGSAKAAGVDVSKNEAVEALVHSTAAEYGRLDFMFNNAGIAILGEIRDMTMAQWEQIININLMGVIYGSTAAYPVMLQQGSGHIINTSSQAGLFTVFGSSAYGVAKHGVVGLSRALRAEGAGLGVKVSVLCPGGIDTNIVEKATILNWDRKAFANLIKWGQMSASKAADIILSKVRKNKGIITVTKGAHFMWLLNRLSPFMGDKITELSAGYLRKTLRKKE